MNVQPRNRLTECLRFIEKEVELGATGDYRFGPGDEFTVRVASSTEDRLKAWALAYRVYREKEYAPPNPQGLWYSLHDALPDTVTLLVEQGQEPIAAVTDVPDSPLGLPADRTFPEETARMRAEGRRMFEAVSLVQASLSERTGIMVVAKLHELLCLVGGELLGCTDLICTVNPRHEAYYRKLMLFEKRGGEAACDKVSGAPAVFLTLNMADVRRHVERAELPDAPKTIYRRFMKPGEAAAVAARFRSQMRPLDEAALRRFFVEERQLMAQTTPEQRAHLQECHAMLSLL
jgi:hypothetical protein